MGRANYPSTLLAKTVIRLPHALRERIQEVARERGGSANSVVVLILQEGLATRMTGRKHDDAALAERPSEPYGPPPDGRAEEILVASFRELPPEARRALVNFLRAIRVGMRP